MGPMAANRSGKSLSPSTMKMTRATYDVFSLVTWVIKFLVWQKTKTSHSNSNLVGGPACNKPGLPDPNVPALENKKNMILKTSFKGCGVSIVSPSELKDWGT